VADPHGYQVGREDDIECFLRELHLLRDVRHPSIVRYHGNGMLRHDDGSEHAFVVLDLLDGVDLRQHLRRGLRVDLVVRWAWQLARGLEYLHGQHIIHRDVKASNVIITTEHDLVLIDFGLALRFNEASMAGLAAGLAAGGAAVAGDGGAAGAAATLLTTYQASRRVGVFGYMAPEIWRCEPFGTAVDIFAFGAVLQRLLNAAWPLPTCASCCNSLRNALWDVCQTSYEALMCQPVVSPRVGPALTSLLQACMDVQPGRRPSAATIVTKLQSAALTHCVRLPTEAQSV